MPPRHTYWTIILEGKPTAFRSHTQEELLPTLRQLQVRHPDAVMKWFARGRLWHTPEEERMAASLKRRRPAEKRTAEWRPGGEHKDPRDRFKVPRDEKRRRFAERLHRDVRSPRPPAASGRPDTPRTTAPRSSRPPGTGRPPSRPPGTGRPPSRPPGTGRPPSHPPSGRRDSRGSNDRDRRGRGGRGR